MLTIIGCGNLNRSDDGAGVRVAQRLAERLALHPVPGVRAFDCGTAGMEVMFAARGSDALLIVDASRTGSEPGTIYEVPGEELARDHEPGFGLHDFRWDHALAAGRKIFKETFPTEVQVWLVEAESTEFGVELTPRVAAAVDLLYERALRHAAEHAARRHAGRGEVELRLRRGALQVPAAVYAAFFDGREGALLYEEGGQLRVMPVEQAAGGAIVKQRNAVGDRSIDAAELLRNKGWDDVGEHVVRARWDSALGALSVEMPARRDA